MSWELSEPGFRMIGKNWRKENLNQDNQVNPINRGSDNHLLKLSFPHFNHSRYSFAFGV